MTCFRILAKTLWHDFQTVLRVQWNSVRKLYFMGKIKNFIVSTHYVKLYRNFKRNWQVIKLAFTLSVETFWGQSSLNEKFCRFSLGLDFEQKKLGRVVTSASEASRGTFWRRTDFSNDLYFVQSGWNDFW